MKIFKPSAADIRAVENEIKARHELDQRFKLFIEKLEPLPAPRFWELVETMKDICWKRLDSKTLIDEFFRRGQFNDGYTFTEACQCYVSWEKAYSVFFSKLDSLFFSGKGDDGFSDFCDSLPLVGRKMYDYIMNSKKLKVENLKDKLFKLCNENSVFYDFIWHGENYFRMFMEEEARRRFPLWIAGHEKSGKLRQLRNNACLMLI